MKTLRWALHLDKSFSLPSQDQANETEKYSPPAPIIKGHFVPGKIIGMIFVQLTYKASYTSNK